jgi:hypothetical protein
VPTNKPDRNTIFNNPVFERLVTISAPALFHMPNIYFWPDKNNLA